MPFCHSCCQWRLIKDSQDMLLRDVCLSVSSPAVLCFLLQVSFLVDEGVSPVLLQLLSCGLCGSKVLSAAASTGSTSTSASASSSSGGGQPAGQSKSSAKKSKKEEKEKEREGELRPQCVCRSVCWGLASGLQRLQNCPGGPCPACPAPVSSNG